MKFTLPCTHVLITTVCLAAMLTFSDTGKCEETQTFIIPPVATAGTGAVESSGFIYALEGRPTPQCHASTLAETPAGLVAAWFAGKHEKNPDVGIWVSRQVKGKWTPPAEVANGVQSAARRHPCWNPVLFQPASGPLMLFYKVGPSPSTWWGMLMTSTDNGRTWSKPAKLGQNDRTGHLLGPVKNKPVQLKDGAILCGSSTEHNGWRVHFELTRDLGKTWQVIGPVNNGKEFGAIQPTILSYKNGDLQAINRSKQNRLTDVWSRDGGKTWGAMQALPLPNPNAGADGVTLADGRQLLIYNHTTRGSKFPSGRNMLNLATSSDGKQWNVVATLERSRGEYSYPAIIQTADGKVHATYTWKRQTVKHVVIDPAKLK